VKKQRLFLLRYLRTLKFRFNQTSKSFKAKTARRHIPLSFGITREGALYLLFVLFLSFAAINTGNNLLFIILAVLLSAIAVSGVVSRNSLKQISLSLQMPENVFVGDNVSIKVSMKNLKRFFPSFSIQAEDPELRREHSSPPLFRKLFAFRLRSSSEKKNADRAVFRRAAYFPILRPGETRSELIVQSFPRRGLYSLQGFWISTRFPFGFFRRGKHIRAKGEVLVYPSVQAISSLFHLLPFLQGRLESRHVGLGENLFLIRKYQDGESARIIDWKAAAKTGELMAREFAQEEDSKFCLILDAQINASAGPDADQCFEKAVSLTASIATHFLEAGAGIEFLTQYDYVPHGIGIDHLRRILRSLAVVKCDRESPAEFFTLWDPRHFPGIADDRALLRIFSEKVFKIIITSKMKKKFPSAIWRSSHAIFFEEL
jgi:uncharacterized protein (DUF58 family)